MRSLLLERFQQEVGGGLLCAPFSQVFVLIIIGELDKWFAGVAQLAEHQRIMKIYRYFAENEKTSYSFLYTFQPKIEEDDIIVFDIFPEIYFQKVTLAVPLSVLTEIGKEMFIPAGLEIEYCDQSRILYSSEEE